MENNASMISKSKKTLGRRKVEMKKIHKKTSLQVTFSKRRTGLFKKASELSLLCGSDIAMLVQSPAGKIFAYGNPSVEAVLHRAAVSSSSHAPLQVGDDQDCSKNEYDEAVKRLERQKTVIEKKRSSSQSRSTAGSSSSSSSWWEESVENKELQELEEYLDALEGLKDNVANRVKGIEQMRLRELEALMELDVVDVDLPGGFGDQYHDYFDLSLCLSTGTTPTLRGPTKFLPFLS